MPEEKEQPRPHGDPLRDEVTDREDLGGDEREDAPVDEADGAKRRRQYEEGADLVSRID